MEYIVLKDSGIEELISLVNQFIADGWKPVGGISTGDIMGSSNYYLQAMIKETNHE